MKNTTVNRRHFEFVSSTINNLRAVGPEERLRIAREFAKAFEPTNASVHREQFINACTARDLKSAQALVTLHKEAGFEDKPLSRRVITGAVDMFNRKEDILAGVKAVYDKAK